jgi:hypothetical protein
MKQDALKNIAYALVIAWIINMIIYFSSVWLGYWDLNYINPKNNAGIDWKTISSAQVILTIIAFLTYSIIMKLVFQGKVYFYALFGMVLFFLAVSVFGMPGLPNKMAAILIVMTVVTAVNLFYFISKIEVFDE